jgi:hypothetical protein
MNGCAPHLNASRIEDDQLRDDQLRSALEPGALTTGASDEERAVKRIRIDKSKVGWSVSCPRSFRSTLETRMSRRAKALIAGAAAC